MLGAEFHNSTSNSFFSLAAYYSGLGAYKRPFPEALSIFINVSDQECQLMIDGVKVDLAPFHIISATYLQNIKIPFQAGFLTVFSFNREFYCLEEHEEEVSCSGIMFFGAHEIPIIKIPDTEIDLFLALIQVFEEELNTVDNNQEKMLQMLLKRLIIKITRYGKTQITQENKLTDHTELIRNYHRLVDSHFRKYHLVADYAELLNRSPKTLSNVFAKSNSKPPINIIHDRIMLEARRLVLESDLSIKEIINKLGFSNANTFFKLFKKHYSLSPNEYKMKVKGKNGVFKGKNNHSPTV